MAVADSLLHAGGPVIAVAAFALVALFTRWAFGSDLSRDRRHRGLVDDGLLTHVATLSRRESALAFRAVLSDAGIRSTLRFPAAHRAEVLVFPEDADRARQLAASFGGGS
ncbi:hypothetical protein SAMN04515665_1192 [Blastococcus sp. DSM 46786]|uniref:hypothetical protein n=1 Tax=Blastococcus sp. DSM 46786 TaxID=1798227 RepID=UPI0008CFACA6|nr:hypothetical protein [Blastococcus sp. DSM 46786]SEL76896.1 hypothetical protein SAMN04515665_1192 [Blastococcus sp. DSM 46786]